MNLTGIHIKNFKAIREVDIAGIENALILVGQNNTGKTTILDAVRAIFGDYRIGIEDFGENAANIEMDVQLFLEGSDLDWLHQNGIVSQYKRPGVRGRKKITGSRGRPAGRFGFRLRRTAAGRCGTRTRHTRITVTYRRYFRKYIT